MHLTLRTLVSSGALLLSAAALSQTYSASNSILSGVQDATGIGNARTSYAFDFSRVATDGDTYINGVELVTDASFDPDIAFEMPTIGFNQGQGDEYVFGTALTGDLDRRFDGLVFKQGAFGNDVAAGFYDFQVRVLGGGNATAMNELALFDFDLEIVPTFSLTVTGSPSQSSVPQGGSFLASASITNTMNRAARINTIYSFIPSFVSASDGMDADFFDASNDIYFGFLGATVAPGQTIADDHSRVMARADQTVGSYTSNYGITGGLYQGDQYDFNVVPYNVNVTAVPEPATMAGLAIGGLALLRRRRK